jgi:hypothetical protein
MKGLHCQARLRNAIISLDNVMKYGKEEWNEDRSLHSLSDFKYFKYGNVL